MQDVNTSDIGSAIREGCNPMQILFDPAHNHLPYFSNVMSGSDPCNGHHSNYSISHVPGRWLNALLNAEDAIGIELNEFAIERLAYWAKISLSHPMGLPQSIDLNSFQPVPVCDLHNLRETMHALNALAKYREDKESIELAKRLIERVSSYFNFDTGEWEENRFRADYPGASTTCTCLGEDETRTFPVSFGRFIGPLVKLYRTTGMAEALELAVELKEIAFRNVLNESGEYDARTFGRHTHSTTSMISSLAQLGEILHDRSIFKRVEAFMRNGLEEIAIGETGWCIESAGRKDLYGEVNNTSDIMETCLILGKQGNPDYFQQAERILRAHFLPSQLRDCSFITQIDVPEQDNRHLLRRARGAFGFPCPYGHEYEEGSWISFNWDIVGGAVGGLCEAYRAIMTRDSEGFQFNLLFDYENDEITFKSPYTHNEVLCIAVNAPGRVRIRLTDRMDRSKISIRNGPAHVVMTIEGSWLVLSGLEQGDCVEVAFPLQTEQKQYVFRDHSFTVLWRGDEVLALDGKGDRLLFFPKLAAFV